MCDSSNEEKFMMQYRMFKLYVNMGMKVTNSLQYTDYSEVDGLQSTVIIIWQGKRKCKI